MQSLLSLAPYMYVLRWLQWVPNAREPYAYLGTQYKSFTTMLPPLTAVDRSLQQCLWLSLKSPLVGVPWGQRFSLFSFILCDAYTGP